MRWKHIQKKNKRKNGQDKKKSENRESSTGHKPSGNDFHFLLQFMWMRSIPSDYRVTGLPMLRRALSRGLNNRDNKEKREETTKRT